jgi:DNA-binding transcriptional MerR regulator
MNELVAATGLPKSTILHYMASGLLPEPVKTSPNMAYYDARCVDRIRLIRQLQRNHRLSLAEIKQMGTTANGGDAVSARVALNELIFGAASDDAPCLDQAGFCAATGLDAEQLQSLLEYRLILPLEEERFDPEDVAMGRVYAQAFTWGLHAADFAYYAELGALIVEHEAALRGRITGPLPEAEDAAVTRAMVGNARAVRTYTIERLFQRKVASMRDLKAQ